MVGEQTGGVITLHDPASLEEGVTQAAGRIHSDLGQRVVVLSPDLPRMLNGDRRLQSESAHIEGLRVAAA